MVRGAGGEAAVPFAPFGVLATGVSVCAELVGLAEGTIESIAYDDVRHRSRAVGPGGSRRSYLDAPVSRSARNRRKRKLFPTTRTLEAAIAAPASRGDARPATASGRATTL